MNIMHWLSRIFAFRISITVRDCDLVGRLYCSATCFLSCMFAITRHNSIAASLMAQPLGLGKALILALGVLCPVMAVDAIVNDVMRPDIQLRWTSRNRHLIYLSASAIYFAAIFVVSMNREDLMSRIGAIIMYAVHGFFCLLIALRDSIRRPGHALCGV